MTNVQVRLIVLFIPFADTHDLRSLNLYVSIFSSSVNDNHLINQTSGTAAGLVRPGISRPRVWIHDRVGGTTTKTVIGYNVCMWRCSQCVLKGNAVQRCEPCLFAGSKTYAFKIRLFTRFHRHARTGGVMTKLTLAELNRLVAIFPAEWK